MARSGLLLCPLERGKCHRGDSEVCQDVLSCDAAPCLLDWQLFGISSTSELRVGAHLNAPCSDLF